MEILGLKDKQVQLALVSWPMAADTKIRGLPNPTEEMPFPPWPLVAPMTFRQLSTLYLLLYNSDDNSKTTLKTVFPNSLA